MQTFRFASVNVGSLTGRSVEVFDMLKRRKVDGAALDIQIVLEWQFPSAQGRVKIMVCSHWIKSVIETRLINARLIFVVITIDETITTMSVYASQ